MDRQKIFDFYKGKKVFVTGHTGFKGSWLVKILLMSGAEVTGYSLEPPTEPSLFEILGLGNAVGLNNITGDVRDFELLSKSLTESGADIVFHLAAQPIVRESYRNPRETYETNVMGTVNICEAVRLCGSVKSFLNVTTDKVYKNNEWAWGYRENEPLDGFDPYSNSKSCSELVTHSYINSFFGGNEEGASVAVSTARAGNVIGGGDFAADRIIPDCVRAVQSAEPIIIRNPLSTRPYQHVLEPLFAYLGIAAEQYQDVKKAGFYNVGPETEDNLNTGELVGLFAKYYGEGFKSEIAPVDSMAPHEANFLKLDTSLLKSTFDWAPVWHTPEAVEKTVEWTKAWRLDPSSGNMNAVCEDQIKEYIRG